ncbi:MAG: hypothetical protein CR991_06585 [Proteobacteria bacterium]|nr:MAG: hypothetical protein CR991_06585 [Pseudomonadota bacterium]
MNIKKVLFGIVVPVLFYTHGAMAQAPSSSTVITLTQVEGDVLVALPSGQHLPARSGMGVSEGSRLMILEKGLVKARYSRSLCEVQYVSNTILHVSDAHQCAAGSKISVVHQCPTQQPCATTKVITVKRYVRPVAQPTMVTTGRTGSIAQGSVRGGFRPLYLLGGVAGLAVLHELFDDDDTASSDEPISP